MGFVFDTSEMITEAFERCGLEPERLEARHLVSARRSLNLLLIEMEANKAEEEWRISRLRRPLSPGTRMFFLPPEVIDVVEVKLVRDDATEYPSMARLSRDEAFRVEGHGPSCHPTGFWVGRDVPASNPHLAMDLAGFGENAFGDGGSSGAGPGGPYLMLYPRLGTEVSDLNLDVVFLRATRPVTELGSEVDATRHWLEAITSGLASKLALKFAPDRLATLTGLFKEQWATARMESRTRGDLIIAARAHGFSRRRRH